MSTLSTVSLHPNSWYTDLPQNWKTGRLKQLFKVVNGSTPQSTEPNYWDGDIKWATPEDLSKISTPYISHTKRKITQEGYQHCGTTMVPKGSIIITTRAPIGNLGIADLALCTNQGCKSLVVRKECDTSYYYYVLLSARNVLESRGNGTTFKELGNFELNEFEIPIPTVEIQKLIASFLDRKIAAIDTLIAKKQRLIQLLEEKRTALIDRAVTKGLNPNAPMKESGISWIGNIPENWEVKRLKYLTRKIIDGTHFTPTYIEDGIPFLRVTDIHGNHIDWESVKFISEIEHLELSKRCHVEKGDVLLSKNGTIGMTFVVNFDRPVSIFVSLCLIKLRKDILLSDFFSSLFQTYAIAEQIAESSKKNTVTNLHLNKISEFWIPVPPIVEQQRILHEVDKAWQQSRSLIQSIELQIEKLQEYRRSLITAAVTGKLVIEKETTS